MIATPSIWNAVETPMRGLKRSIAPVENRLGLLPLERDRELARFQLVEKLVRAHRPPFGR